MAQLEDARPAEEAGQRPIFPHVPASGYGEGQAIEAIGSVAAPLLAGFGLTSAMVVVQSPQSLRWPGVTLTLLVAAVVVLVMVVQFSFWARHFWGHFGESLAWWPDGDNGYRKNEVEEDVARHLTVHKTWAGRVRGGYDIGVVLLLLALCSAVWPSSSEQGHGWGPLPAILVSLALAYEVLWMVAKRRSSKRRESTGWIHRWDRLAWWIAPQDPIKAPVEGP